MEPNKETERTAFVYGQDENKQTVYKVERKMPRNSLVSVLFTALSGPKSTMHKN